ncbi:MAG: hypothetical protein ABI380_04485 [Edaphobacter sp.]
MGSMASRYARTNTEITAIAPPRTMLAVSRDPKIQAISLWSLLKRLARLISMTRRARIVAAVVPTRHWFRAAKLMSRWHARVTGAMGKSRRGISEAYMREDWLIELSQLGPFPVPMRVCGAEFLKATTSDRCGVILCGTHVPLIRVVLRAAILHGRKMELVVAQPNSSNVNNTIQPTGLSECIPIVAPGLNGLLKIRTVLRRNGLAACTLDERIGSPSRPDLLVLAGRLGARVVTYRASLAPDGVVNVSFQNAPYPFCDSDEAIEANLRAIREDERRTIASLDDLGDPNASIG